MAELLTPRQAAARLGISYPTVKQWLYRGKLEAVRTPGGHYRIPGDQVDAALKPARGGRRTASRKAEISGRNQLRGTVEEIRTEGLLAQVKISLGEQSVTAIITADAVRDMRLRVGQKASALIKSTEVMVIKG